MSGLNAALIIPAAGSGLRLGHELPKALVPISGKPLLLHTLHAAAEAAIFAETVVAVPAEHRAAFEFALDRLGPLERSDLGRLRVVNGGATRRESISLALEGLSTTPDLVCVHDAARPLVAPQAFEAVLRAAQEHGAATLAHRPTDSVRRDAEFGSSEQVTVAEDRDRLWLVETPQAFRAELLVSAHRHAQEQGLDAGDDCSLVERFGAAIHVVPSQGGNIKVTTVADLRLVEATLSVLAERR